MDFAKLLSCCLQGDSDEIISEKQALLDSAIDKQPLYESVVDKQPNLTSMQQPIHRSVDTTAVDFIYILLDAKKNDESLTQNLHEAVGTSGWSERLAEKILDRLKITIVDGRNKMGDAMNEAVDKAYAAADKVFADIVQNAKEHPLELAATIVITIIAIGVLAELAPLVVELLGFGELGPIEGSFAAWWEALYGGYIPAGSLFSYLQRLGMIWRK
ncbi:hypothetical protein F5X68DRAFT_231337 [Plectosphaerella plurivora]|uniref:Uncharacterized protein n=1 Tax=Plectosphaerella plurivora TaxID=936078 RepID=A0A9P8VBM4_9PEZI|nr:hypothetical protein F5X68DRAFT_231337 [Plectosphaerella plurivora]